MLTHYGGFPAVDVLYDTGGHLIDPAAESELLTFLTGDGKDTTDLFIISHGWNNNIDEARGLYGAFFSSMQTVISGGGVKIPAGRQFAIMAIFWPSKRFTDTDLIPGGAASVDTALDSTLNGQLDTFKELFASNPASAAKIDYARSLISKLDVSQSAQDDYVAALVSLLPPVRGERDEGLDDARTELDSPALSGHVVLQRLSVPVMPVMTVPTTGGATSVGIGNTGQGAAAGIFGNLFGGVKAAAANLGNLFTYYTMKDRAGIVGRTGVIQTLLKVKAARVDIKVHLVGHSFGGRLVTSVANSIPDAARSVSSMTLLEAAYSHNGLGKNWDGQGNDGAFRSIIDSRKVNGPILITHSAHDFPVGTAYPVASRLMNQVASALVGGPTDKYGGMGRNGAQHTPEAFDDTLHPVGVVYNPLPAAQWVRNLNGDGPQPKPTITSHGDVAKPEVAYALLTAIA